MKRERLVVLLGILVALVFFYLGLNAWIKNKEEKITPPPVVIQPKPQPTAPPTPPSEPAQPPAEEKPKEEEKKAKKVEEKPKEEKRKEEVKRPEKENLKQKTYLVQVGAFSKAENAQKALKKAKDLGYKGSIVEEDGLYKVRLKITTADIRKDVSRLKGQFGSVIIKQ
ncbi:SPOR domain-containing protein [Hydrogenobacter thermophilus]|uniref:SPOR domain-containing protein n=1 Tax=Hydrogenobacter thermophilus TaxID=940 RepID=UPI0030F6A6EA